MIFSRKILKKISIFYKQKKGAIAVEFSLCFTLFFFLFLFIFEIARIYLIASAVDLSIAESAKFSAIYSGSNNYQQAFTEKLHYNLANYPFLSSKNEIKTKTIYCQDISQLLNNYSGCSDDPADKRLVVHTLEYKYSPMFFYFTERVASKYLKREIISVLEHQRNIK